MANYSHRNLTLAGWLQPRSRRFCTWNGARCYFWDVTWWRNPRGSDRRRTLIQNPHPSPLQSTPTLFPLPCLHLCFSHFGDSTNPGLSALHRRRGCYESAAKPSRGGFMYEYHTLQCFIGWHPINAHKCKNRSEQGRATLCERHAVVRS